MKLRQLATCMVAAFCGLAGTPAAGTLDVTPQAAHDGIYGMVVTVAGAGDRAYVEDDHPDQEQIYRATFWINPSGLSMAGKTSHIIFQTVGADPDNPSKLASILELELLRPAKLNRYQVRAHSFFDDHSRNRKVTTRALTLDGTAWHHVLLEWRAASSNASPDGLTRLSVIGGPQAGATTELVGKVPDERHFIDRARLGAVKGVDSSTTGVCLFDTFESYRTLNEP